MAHSIEENTWRRDGLQLPPNVPQSQCNLSNDNNSRLIKANWTKPNVLPQHNVYTFKVENKTSDHSKLKIRQATIQTRTKIYCSKLQKKTAVNTVVFWDKVNYSALQCILQYTIVYFVPKHYSIYCSSLQKTLQYTVVHYSLLCPKTLQYLLQFTTKNTTVYCSALQFTLSQNTTVFTAVHWSLLQMKNCSIYFSTL